jgi:hypothetical protein
MIGADIDRHFDATSFEIGHPAIRPRKLAHDAARRDEEGQPRLHLAPVEQAHQFGELGECEMRRAERHRVERSVPRGGQFAMGADKIIGHHHMCLRSPEHGAKLRRFRGHARAVPQFHPAR